jgi:hypothetical protein
MLEASEKKSLEIAGCWLITITTFALVIQICLSRSYLPEYFGNGLGKAEYFRISLMAFATIWFPYWIASKSRTPPHTTRFIALLVLLFLPLAATRIMPDSIARTFLDLTYLTTAAVGLGGLLTIHHRPKQFIWLSVLGCLLGFAIFTATLGMGKITPFAMENSLASLQHRDTLFHAAIINMIEFHGLSSIGLDGLVPLSYHVLFHKIAGAVGTWLDIAGLQASFLVSLTITLPIMFLALCHAIAALKPQGWPVLGTVSGLSFFLSWPLLFSLLQTPSYFSSESYILSLLIMLAVLPVMLEWATSELQTPGKFLILLTFALAVVLASMSKISTGAVMSAGISMFMTITGRNLVKNAFLAFIFCVVPFIAIFGMFFGSGTASSGIFGPLKYLFDWHQQALFHIVLTGVTGLVIWKQTKLDNGSWKIPCALFPMVLAATISSLLLDLPAGAASYFANPGMWICILLLAALLPVPAILSGMKAVPQMTFALLLFSGLSFMEKDRWKAMGMLAGANEKQYSKNEDLIRLNQRIVQEAETVSKEHGRDYLIFVKPDFSGFWKQLDICWAQSFVLPALTAQPMLRGLPPSNSGCDVTRDYGLAAYELQGSSSYYVDDEELCQSALKVGFPAVLVIANSESRRIACTGKNGKDN